MTTWFTVVRAEVNQTLLPGNGYRKIVWFPTDHISRQAIHPPENQQHEKKKNDISKLAIRWTLSFEIKAVGRSDASTNGGSSSDSAGRLSTTSTIIFAHESSLLMQFLLHSRPCRAVKSFVCPAVCSWIPLRLYSHSHTGAFYVYTSTYIDVDICFFSSVILCT